MADPEAHPGAVGSAFDDETFARLQEIEEDHPWFTTRRRLITWALDRHAPAARSFLDVGCGTGLVLSALGQHRPGLALSGVEPTDAAFRFAAQRVPAARLVVAGAADLAALGTFDAVGSFDVLEHLENDEAAVREFHRATRDGGVLLVTVPQHPWLWSAVDVASGHQRRYTRRGLRSLLDRNGWDIELMTSFVTLPLPAMALSRALRRRSPEELDLYAELRASSRARLIFAPMFALERALIRTGFSLPAGGSLLAVARRRA